MEMHLWAVLQSRGKLTGYKVGMNRTIRDNSSFCEL